MVNPMELAPPDRHANRSITRATSGRVIRPAEPGNLSRLESNLRRNSVALQYVLDSGLTADTIHKFCLGFKPLHEPEFEEETVGALCYPLISYSGEAVGRYGYLAIPMEAGKLYGEDAWGVGKSLTYYSGAVAGKTTLLVVDNPWQLWVLDQHLRGTELAERVVVICPSYGRSIPDEWKSSDFWSGWADVYFLHANTSHSDLTFRPLLRYCSREIFRVATPDQDCPGWDKFFGAGGTPEQFVELFIHATVFSDPPPKSEADADTLGEFAVSPVNINGAFVNGHLYYPFTIERREVEEVGHGGGGSVRRLVASYVTKVVRSDGAVLDFVRLAAPRGTPRDRQVLALTDGTRVEREPLFSHYATWQLGSIQSFITAMQSAAPAPHRQLGQLLADIIAHLRRSVWLPYECDYTVLAVYAALSFIYQVFDAIPLLIVRGDKGTGKSELGDAISKVSCNATVIGQGSPAGVIRLMNEVRGLVVLDDLESVGKVFEDASFGDINQMLKLSYKKGTGRKAITDKNGRTTIFDFYGPKVINNTRGVDPILGSRMLQIQTRQIPDALRRSLTLTGSEPEEIARLRNELHVWGMATAGRVYTHYSRSVNSRSDRQAEIAAPLRTIAEVSGDEQIRDSLEAALQRQFKSPRIADNPVDLLKEAVDNCIRQGADKQITAAQVMLELRRLCEEDLMYQECEEVAVWRRPEWIGQQLRKLGIRNHALKVGRARLYGVITRIYDLRPEYVMTVLKDLSAARESHPKGRQPFDFCERNVCSACAYEKICATTIRGLQQAKSLNRGKSGQCAVVMKSLL